VSNATRAVREAPRMAVDRPQRFGFRAAVNALSVAAMVAFMQTLRPAQQPPARSAVVPATPGR
jgi:hypothetical protein